MIRLGFLLFLGFVINVGTLRAQQATPFKKKEHQTMIYSFVNDVLKQVGRHEANTTVYLEQLVRGNKCYESKPDRIFPDRIKLLDISLLDSLLTQKDIEFMKQQAENKLFSKWDQKKIKLKTIKVLPSASSRKVGNHTVGQYLGISLPFFSTDGKSAIFFICRQGLEDGWDATTLYRKTAHGWRLVTTKLILWHVK